MEIKFRGRENLEAKTSSDFHVSTHQNKFGFFFMVFASIQKSLVHFRSCDNIIHLRKSFFYLYLFFSFKHNTEKPFREENIKVQTGSNA